jgi:hypothetical protein
MHIKSNFVIFLKLPMLNITFRAGAGAARAGAVRAEAASRYGSSSTKMMRLRLSNIGYNWVVAITNMPAKTFEQSIPQKFLSPVALKGPCQEIFDLWVFSSNDSIWAPDLWVKAFLHMASFDYEIDDP